MLTLACDHFVVVRRQVPYAGCRSGRLEAWAWECFIKLIAYSIMGSLISERVPNILGGGPVANLLSLCQFHLLLEE